jgi:cytochrome bd-type quinol oxidase subunit 2
MQQVSTQRTFARISLLTVAIIILAVITAWIHLDRAIMMGFFSGHSGAAGGGHAPGGKGPGGHGGGAPAGIMGLIFSNLALLFVLNFVGYIVLVIALYLPQLKRFQRIIRWALIVFTLITILAYFAIVGLRDNPTGYVDKAVEIVLIVLLLIEDRKATHLARA